MIDDAALSRLRADTPAAARGRIHLNNAGAALVPRPVRAAVDEHLDLEDTIGGYEAADASRDRIDAVYASVGRLLNAAAEDVALVENATTAVALVLSAVDPGPGDAIVTTQDDYASNQIMYLSLARRRGVRVVRAPDLPEGGVDPAALAEAVRREAPVLVSLTWIPTNSGLVQPAAEVGAICRERGVPYMVDACQAVGQMPIDVGALGCDYLAASGRKFLRGPRGTGLLYVSPAALERGATPLLPDMRGATWTDPNAYAPASGARRFENWEYAHALSLGLGAAVEYALAIGLADIQERAWGLAADLRERLARVRGVRVLDRGPELCAIVTARIDGFDAEAVVQALRAEGINTSAVVRSAAVIDMDRKGATTALRISPHYYNTSAEIRALTHEVEALLEEAGG
ncbi:MAG TPA: aminotransferase class V-fold PLP-dependent enzyme [Longimicrobiales bacterium]|nr:aminotransferase class V-fold PLP-dependent enzyme [Longimicrobiales bacterium]